MFRDDLFDSATHTIATGKKVYYGACRGMSNSEIDNAFRRWKHAGTARLEIAPIQ
jgi:hypothetical protein